MGDWYYRRVESKELAARFTEEIQEKQIELLLSGKSTRNAVVFLRREKNTGAAHYYFSPAARGLATACGASPCAKPSREEAGGMLCGDLSVIDHLFENLA